MKTLILIDSHALIHRCYHALPNLTTPNGESIGAVYGTIRIIFKIIKEFKPDYLAACFDLAEPTFRHKEYKEYKATRPKTDESLIPQFAKVKQFFETAQIKYFESAGYEADDLIGTLVKKFSSEKDLKIIILTGDLDTLQLVNNNSVVVYTMRKGVQDTIIYNEEQVKKRYGLTPLQLVDFKALKGDLSDNILGVKGIGEKTAIELIKNFGSLENLYQTIENKNFEKSVKNKLIKPKVIKLLLEQKEQAFFSKYLATLNCDVSLETKLSDLKFEALNKESLINLFKEWRFESLLNQLTGEHSFNFSNQIMAPANNIIISESLEEIKDIFPKSKAVISFNGNQIDLLIENKNYRLPINQQTISRLRGCSLIGYDLKNLIKEIGRNENGFSLIFDIKIAQWLINSGMKNYSLERIWHSLFKTPLPAISSVEIIKKIQAHQQEKLKELGLESVFQNIEMPLISILAKMESQGIKIDSVYFQKLTEEIKKETSQLEKDILNISGTEFNINSPKQLSDVLFKKLNIINKHPSKTSTGLLSTRENELAKIRELHPIIPLILKYRELMKLKTTYLEPLPALMDKNSRIHTNYNQTGTATGRLSSENPNLQNIPAEGEWAKKIRKGFIAENGYQFLGFDYSQIELRIAASLSRDPKMQKVFLENGDIHALTAAEINNVKITEVTNEMRRQAKTLNFGILYGMGAKAFGETAGISKEEAKKFIEEYFHDFPYLKQWQEKILLEAQQTGCARTLTGRIRWVYDLVSGNQKYRSLAERAAINFPIQGLAADIIKNAMVKIDRFINENQLQNDVRLLLQIHDELIFEVKKEKINWVKNEIQKMLEENEWLKVPLKTQYSLGQTLADLK